MNILVTGGAGFIGSNFLNYMVKKHENDYFVNLDAITYAAKLENLDKIGTVDNYRFICGDVTDTEFVMKLFAKEHIDTIVNFAAETHVDNSVIGPSLFTSTNVCGTQSLLEAARAYGIGRFHQVSTDEVYGDLPIDKKEIIFTEESPVNASSPYSASKAAADILAIAYHRTYGMDITISRSSNNYGPCQNVGKFIPKMIMKALNDEKLPVYSNGRSIRDWLYVADHCKAIDLIMRNGKSGEIYNISGQNEIENIEVVNSILKKLGKDESLIEYVEDKHGHELRHAMNHDKMKNELGWQPKYSFDAGISETIEWFKAKSEY